MATLLHDILDEKAQKVPDHVFIRKNNSSLTYKQVYDLHLTYAHWMHANGIRRGDRVIILAPHAPETVAAIFAVSRIGAMYVIVNDKMPCKRFKELIDDCEPSLIVAVDASASLPPNTSIPFVLFEEMAKNKERQPPTPITSFCIPIDPVSLIYTSGSTSTPKAIISTHHQVLFAARAILSQLNYHSEDTVFCCLPLFFDYGLYQIYLTCMAEAVLVLSDAADAGPPLLSRLQTYDITVFPLMPALAATLISLIIRRKQPPKKLRMITNTGAMLHRSMADQLRQLIPGLAVVPMFGLTECKRVSIMSLNGDLERPEAVGRPLPGTEVFIVDQDNNVLPPGEIGELVVRGQHVMAGYWRAPELTAKRFRRDEFGQPLLYTGDLCRLDAEGYLYFVSREDDIYKERGFRISAIEVEAAALDIPSVQLAALLRPTADRGAVLFVTGDISPSKVFSDLAKRLEDYKIPATCYVMDELPLNANGKVDKKLLQSLLINQATHSRRTDDEIKYGIASSV